MNECLRRIFASPLASVAAIKGKAFARSAACWFLTGSLSEGWQTMLRTWGCGFCLSSHLISRGAHLCPHMAGSN